MRLLTISNTPFLPATAGNRQRLNQLLAYLAAHGVELGMLMLPAADGASWNLTGMRAVSRLLDDLPYWKCMAAAAAAHAARRLSPDATFGPLLAEMTAAAGVMR